MISLSSRQATAGLRWTRRRRGELTAELPPILFVLFFLFVFPIMNLGTLALRYALAATACREGAHAASTAYTFETGSTGKPSALSSADTAARDMAAKFSGINVKNVDVDILITDIPSKAVTRSSGKLSSPANTQKNLYALETIVTADLSPLIMYSGPFLGNIAGITGPWTTTLRAREFAENPQGLNQ